MSETVLWTNPDTTISFASQNITLKESITNYDMLRFKFKYNISTQTYNNVYYTVADFNNSLNQNRYFLLTSLQVYSLGLYMRRVSKINDITIYISDVRREYSSKYADGGNNNGAVIPVEIVGIKVKLP